jgi:hypothetical protein
VAQGDDATEPGVRAPVFFSSICFPGVIPSSTCGGAAAVSGLSFMRETAERNGRNRICERNG